MLTATLYAASALWACGGPQVPTHDGYRSNWDEGWEKPRPLELDEDNEAEVDGELSYPKRRRVRWYSVTLPGDGELEMVLTNSPLGVVSEEEEEEEDAEDPFDVGFELYDQNYKMLLRADKGEDDAGDRKKARTAYELRKGTYLVHVFLQRRLDEAEYTLRVKYSSGQVEPQTNFPKEVAYVEDLAVVPALDDAPPPEKKKPRPRCRGSKCKKKPRGDDPPKKDPEETGTTPTADKLRVKIIVVRGQSGGGTAITVAAGTDRGVDKGWTGQVVTKKGQAIPGGEFTITSAKNTSARGSVNISPDAVKQAGYAILRAP